MPSNFNEFKRVTVSVIVSHQYQKIAFKIAEFNFVMIIKGKLTVGTSFQMTMPSQKLSTKFPKENIKVFKQIAAINQLQIGWLL